MTMALKTIPFDAAKYLDDSQSQAELLSDALASGEARYVAAALGVIARARGMSAVAQEAGVTREALYKALKEDGNPTLETVMGVANAVGLRLQAVAAE
jgi:probable addiction module antidote protein